MAAGHNITVFHNIDFVAVFGWAPDDSLRVEVLRNGVVIGSAAGKAADGPDGAGLEVNHGVEGTPADGDCWEGTTPDILPGDEIMVTGPGGVVDRVVVDNIRFTSLPFERLGLPGRNGDIVVEGVAKRANGDPIPATFLDSAEFRDGGWRTVPRVVDTSATRGPGAFEVVYPGPDYSEGVFKDDGRDVAARKAALLDPAGGHAIGFGHVAPLPPEAMLHDGLTDSPGPGIGCGDSPSAQDAVTAATPTVLNIAAFAAGGNLALSGVAHDSTAGTVTIDDRDAATPAATAVTSDIALSAKPPTAQTWTASIPMDQLAALSDGTLDVTLRVTRTSGGTITGAPFTMVKDRVAPAAPTVSPPAGTYVGTQSVTVNPAPGTDVLRYTIGGAGVGDPTTGSAPVSGPIAITSSQTLKARGFDNAGNVGPVLTAAYTITQPAVPAAPSAQSAPSAPSASTPRSSTVTPAARAVTPPVQQPAAPPGAPSLRGVKPASSSATVSWNAPTSTGTGPVTGYDVQVFLGDAHVRTIAVGASARSLTVSGLSNGEAYRFRVRAVSAAGAGSFSAWSALVTPALVPDAPQLRKARDGKAGGIRTARARWSAAEDAGSPVTAYRVIAKKISRTDGDVVAVKRTRWLSPDRVAATMRLPGGLWVFQVRARNETGRSPLSERSNTVRSR